MSAETKRVPAQVTAANACRWCGRALEYFDDASRAAQGDASPTPSANGSLEASGDGSVVDRSSERVAVTSRSGRRVPRSDREFCSQKCRQTAFRLRRRRATEAAAGVPMRFAYADPPYPGLAARYYKNEASYGGEVDHVALVASLTTSYDGWALSTSARALRSVLPLCPEGARVCAWVKPSGVPTASNGLHNQWEPLIVWGGRQRPPGRRDWLSAKTARGGGTLPGRKPLAFCAWLFGCLGMRAGDELVDLYPGTGVVGRAWRELSREYSTDVFTEATT